jgi:hypothetical protein
LHSLVPGAALPWSAAGEADDAEFIAGDPGTIRRLTDWL